MELMIWPGSWCDFDRIGYWLTTVPENTLEAFQSAWDLGAEAAEMDVRLSAPGTDSKTGVDYPGGEVFSLTIAIFEVRRLQRTNSASVYFKRAFD